MTANTNRITRDSQQFRQDPRIRARLLELVGDEGLERTEVSIFHIATELTIGTSLGFSPLINPKTGARYPHPTFSPFWTARDHGGFFELQAKFGRDDETGFSFVFFVWDDESATELTILRACREFASAEENAPALRPVTSSAWK